MWGNQIIDASDADDEGKKTQKIKFFFQHFVR